MISVLLGLVKDSNGTWSVAEKPSDNLNQIMNDRSARLVQAGLKQRRSEVDEALATSPRASFHAVQWIIDSKIW